jgi:hypothetical protein
MINLPFLEKTESKLEEVLAKKTESAKLAQDILFEKAPHKSKNSNPLAAAPPWRWLQCVVPRNRSHIRDGL